MQPSSSSPRVVVVGGGVFGISSAVHLARLGAPVTLLTEAKMSSGASGRSLSWLNAARRPAGEYYRLRMAGIDRYRTLATRHPGAGWLRFDGGLTWDADDSANGIAAAFRMERDIGYDAQLLSADEAAAVIPGVDAAAITPQGAIFNPGEGWVDLPSLIDMLRQDFLSRGGKLVEHAGRASVDISGGTARAVTTEKAGRFESDAVLLATGAAVPAMLSEVGVRVLDATPISLLVKSRPGNFALRAVLNTPRVAVRPTPDGALVLDSAWSEEEVDRRDDGTFVVREETVQGLLREASAVLEGNPKLELESYGVGPKPIPDGGEPVFGAIGAIPHYHVAFSHSGATLGLIAGELLAGEILSGEPHPMLASFRPTRFEAAGQTA